MFRQRVGRCLRPKPDGSAAVILDHVGNVFRHGLPDAPHEWSLDSAKRRNGEKVAPAVRECRACSIVFPIGATPDGDCPSPDAPDCFFMHVDIPKETSGTLAEMSFNPPWAEGIDIRTARGRDFFRLVELAGDTTNGSLIQVVRGYKAAWSGTADASQPSRARWCHESPPWPVHLYALPSQIPGRFNLRRPLICDCGGRQQDKSRVAAALDVTSPSASVTFLVNRHGRVADRAGYRDDATRGGSRVCTHWVATDQEISRHAAYSLIDRCLNCQTRIRLFVRHEVSCPRKALLRHACYRQHFRKKRQSKNMFCTVCNMGSAASRKDARFCSDACRQWPYRRRAA